MGLGDGAGKDFAFCELEDAGVGAGNLTAPR